MIECVPNFSEGRDSGKVNKIVAAIETTPGIAVLGWELDADHNRSVVTMAGPVDAVVEAAVRAVGRAADLIDLREHEGKHPRVGAADVVPFVPLEGSTMEDCVGAAHRAGDEIWRRFKIPSYFYESAAKKPERMRLEKTRRKGFDGGPPDAGDVAAHPTAGACMVGARRILIAYNVDLKTRDRAIAQEIAEKIRESSGGFKFVKAMGLYLPSRDCAQVTMNLTRYEEIPLMDLLSAIDREATRLGAAAGDGELIGLIPKRAFQMAPGFFRRAANFNEDRIIENRLAKSLVQK